MSNDVTKQALEGFYFQGKKYAVVPLTLIKVDEKYQRQLTAAKELDDYDPRAVRALTVSLRKDGFYWTMDGYHRLYRMQQREETHAACEIHELPTVKDEAALFVRLNNVRVVQPKDKFNAAYVSGDKTAVAIWKTVNRHGYILRGARGNATQTVNAADPLSCVAAIQKVYDRMGAGILDDTLSIIAECFRKQTGVQTQSAAKSDMFVSGLATFLFEKQPSKDDVASMLEGTQAREMVKYVTRISGAARKDAVKHLAAYLNNRLKTWKRTAEPVEV